MQHSGESLHMMVVESVVALLKTCEGRGRKIRFGGKLRLSHPSQNTEVCEVSVGGVDADDLGHRDAKDRNRAGQGVDLRGCFVDLPVADRPDAHISHARKVGPGQAPFLSHATQVGRAEATHHSATHASAAAHRQVTRNQFASTPLNTRSDDVLF